MSSSKLLASYRADASAADRAVKGKHIRVWGKALDVTRKASGELTLIFGPGTKTEPPQVQCLFPPGRDEPSLARGSDVTVDGTCEGLSTNVVLRNCAVPHCAEPVCEKLRDQGMATDCTPALKEWSDSATFRVPGKSTGSVSGYVECEPSAKIFYSMVNDLRDHSGPNQIVLGSAKARVVINLASDQPISGDLQARERAFVEAL